MSAPSLLQLQRQIQARVLHGADGLLSMIADDTIADAARRARVYEDAYRLRLLEVLGNDFPALKAHVGAAEFDEMASRYLVDHPSKYASVRYVGAEFSRWLHSQACETHWIELAAFEWAQGEVFDAADSDIVVLGDIAAVAPGAWPGLRLLLKPAIRFLSLQGNAPAFVVAHGVDEPLPAAARCDAAISWLLWRRGFDVYWRALEPDENAALRAASQGTNFGELCESLRAWHPDHDVAMRAASLLKLWISDELIARLELDDTQTLIAETNS